MALTPEAARRCLNTCLIRPETDFHALPSEKVEYLVEAAKLFKYRKPRNANGSTGRYFHAYLVRLVSRKEAP